MTRCLTRDEALLYVNVVAGAGNETTNRLIGWAGKVLGEHPDQRRALAADPSLVPNAVEELLRYEAPGPIIGRYVARDVEIHGQVVPAGSALLLLAHAANRDERRFADPDRFDIHREIGQHLTFGHGIHFCLGAALARVEGRIAIEEVLKRFPDWEVDTRERPNGVVLDDPGLGRAPGGHAVSGYLGLDTDQERVTFGGFIADIAERYGDREALVFGDRRLTFRRARARGAPVRPGASRGRRHEGLVGGAHAREPAGVRHRRVRRRQHRRRRRAGQHVRVDRRAGLHPAPLRCLPPDHPGSRCSTTGSSTSCSRATPSSPRAHPGQLRSTCLPVPPAHRLPRSRAPGHGRVAGTSSSPEPTRSPRCSSTRRWPRCTRTTRASSSTPPARAPTPRRCCTPTALR